jgi:site-specific DNA-methyltransferase (adenine-specific)
VVLDPFAGSGSTLLAAQMNKRQFIGIELLEEYIEIAKLRLIDYDKQLKLF